MLVLNLQFWEGDKKQAMALARLIADIEPRQRTDVTFLFSARFDCEHDMETVDYVRKKFKNTVIHTTRRKATGWPAGPNALFSDSYQFCIEQIRSGGIRAEAILFMESDCVPLDVRWIDHLIAEYMACRRPILGAWIIDGKGGVHINGNCIIHKDFWKLQKSFLNPGPIAWDAQFAPLMVSNAAPSRMIFSDYHLGISGYNEWKGCEHLFATKNYGPGHPLAGQAINPVWYHGPKDMRGIECARRRLLGEVGEGETKNNMQPSKRSATQPLTDIFVVTYARDANWMEYLLRSIQKYARGFRQTIVVYPNSDKAAFEYLFNRFPNTKWVGFDQAEDGHMHHNIVKCSADTYSDADYFLHIDSDCVFLEATYPCDYFTDGKPDLVFTAYDKIERVPWREVTERALGIKCPHETMRRHPFIYPRALYKATRGRVEAVNKMPFDQYVFNAPKLGGAHRGFSEFNALGCTGLYLHPEWFNLVDTEKGVRQAHVRQYWSWSGLTEQEKFELEWVTKDYDKPTTDRDEWDKYVETQQ